MVIPKYGLRVEIKIISRRLDDEEDAMLATKGMKSSPIMYADVISDEIRI